MSKSGRNRAGIAGLALTGLFALGAGSAAAQDVDVNQDQQADFGKCATYAWIKGQTAPDPLVDRKIVNAIETALAAKGARRVKENPGCFITYHAAVNEQRSLQVYESGRVFGGFGSVDVKTILSGTLVVDIVDASSEQLIWRAIAKDTVSDKSEKNEKKLAKCTQKMFKDFPILGVRG
jgi:hypothetical protein